MKMLFVELTDAVDGARTVVAAHHIVSMEDDPAGERTIVAVMSGREFFVEEDAAEILRLIKSGS